MHASAPGASEQRRGGHRQNERRRHARCDQRPEDLRHASGGGRHQDRHEVASGLLTAILNRR